MGEGKKIKGRSTHGRANQLNGEWAKQAGRPGTTQQPVCRNVLEQTHYIILEKGGRGGEVDGVTELCKCGKVGVVDGAERERETGFESLGEGIYSYYSARRTIFKI